MSGQHCNPTWCETRRAGRSGRVASPRDTRTACGGDASMRRVVGGPRSGVAVIAILMLSVGSYVVETD